VAEEPFPLAKALDGAGDKPSPTADRDLKKNYAQRFSNQLAQTIADALRPKYPTVTPTASGGGQEAAIEVVKGHKRLDVGAIDPALGLLLCVSIKTYSFQDYSPKNKNPLGRWTKNTVRNDHELRGEAMVLHQRQPYSVLIGLMFEPFATCDDGNPKSRRESAKSSFAHHVNILSKRTGRGKRAIIGGPTTAWVDLGADDPRHDLFERVFIGLYHPDGPERGAVRFFDVENPPPRFGRPSDAQTLSFEQFINAVDAEVQRRNKSAPTWADADDESVD
jgi:hypothetical protein